MDMNAFADSILIFKRNPKNLRFRICFVKFIDSGGCISTKTDVINLILSKYLWLSNEQPIEILLCEIVFNILDFELISSKQIGNLWVKLEHLITVDIQQT